MPYIMAKAAIAKPHHRKPASCIMASTINFPFGAARSSRVRQCNSALRHLTLGNFATQSTRSVGWAASNGRDDSKDRTTGGSLDDLKHYGRGAIAFHWAVAVLVIVVGTLGLLHDSWPKRTHVFWINIHALLGLLLWAMVLLRYGWRIRHAPPSLPPEVGAVYRSASRTVHLGLYVLLFTTPILGIVTFLWHGRTLDLGLFQLHSGIASNRAVFEPTEDFHGYLAYGLFALAALHILAALWHQFVRRDRILERMWPSSSRRRAEEAAELASAGSEE
jgi:cytochrome b561